MTRDEIINTLRRREADLRARGVCHAALFGSAARGKERPGDIDILVEFDPDAHVTVFDYIGLKSFIAGFFDAPVDVVDRDSLKPRLGAPAARNAIYAF